MARDTSHGALHCCCSSSLENKKTLKKIKNSRARVLRRKAACALGNRGLLWTAQKRPKQPRVVCVVGGSVSTSLCSCRFHRSQAERARVERVSHERPRDLLRAHGRANGCTRALPLSRLYTLYRSSRNWNSLAHGRHHPRFPDSYPGCPSSAGVVCSLFLLRTVTSGRCRGDVVT